VWPPQSWLARVLRPSANNNFQPAYNIEKKAGAQLRGTEQRELHSLRRSIEGKRDSFYFLLYLNFGAFFKLSLEVSTKAFQVSSF